MASGKTYTWTKAEAEEHRAFLDKILLDKKDQAMREFDPEKSAQEARSARKVGSVVQHTHYWVPDDPAYPQVNLTVKPRYY
jgi:hypothetical protein